MLTSVLILRGQHDRRRRIGEGSNPCTVLNEKYEEEDSNTDNDESTVQPGNPRGLVLLQDGGEDMEPCGDILDGIIFGSFGGRRLVLLGLLGGHFRVGDASGTDRVLLYGRRIGAIRHPRVNIGVQNCRKSHSSGDANTRGKSQHQPNHDAGKVGSNERVDDNKHMFVPEFPETKDHAGWEEENEELEVHEE